jgi:hypothetical protein
VGERALQALHQTPWGTSKPTTQVRTHLLHAPPSPPPRGTGRSHMPATPVCSQLSELEGLFTGHVRFRDVAPHVAALKAAGLTSWRPCNPSGRR